MSIKHTIVVYVNFNISSSQDIMAKRNQKPEVRKAQREQAVRAAKDQKKATVKKPVVKVRSFNSFIFIEVKQVN